MRNSIVGILLGAVTFTTTPAEANTLCLDAKDCYYQGAAAYAQRNYDRALIFFKESYRRKVSRKAKSVLLYNIANTYANLRQPQVAIEYLNLFLADNPLQKKETNHLPETLKRYNQGLEFYNQKNYSAAAQKFKEVYNRAGKGLRVIVARDLAESYEQLLRFNDKIKLESK